jgi:hypothetical protein
VSTEGLLRAVRAARAGWEIWQSRRPGGEASGILYATPARRGSPDRAVTLAADTPAGLDDLIGRQEDYWDGLAPSPPGCYLTGIAAF